MAHEHVTRLQIIRLVDKIHMRHLRGLTKEWLYENLKPIVDGLEADIKEAKAAEEAAKKAAAKQAKAVQAKDAPAQPDARATNDLEDTSKKPAEERANKKATKAKEKK